MPRGSFNFIVIICSQDMWGLALGETVYLDGPVHTYVHSIEHTMERERSDGCNREKHRGIFFQCEGLSDGVKGIFA